MRSLVPNRLGLQLAAEAVGAASATVPRHKSSALPAPRIERTFIFPPKSESPDSVLRGTLAGWTDMREFVTRCNKRLCLLSRQELVLGLSPQRNKLTTRCCTTDSLMFRSSAGYNSSTIAWTTSPSCSVRSRGAPLSPRIIHRAV